MTHPSDNAQLLHLMNVEDKEESSSLSLMTSSLKRKQITMHSTSKIISSDQFQLGRRIRKKFGNIDYYGTIEFVHDSFVSIIYDDGDNEAGDIYLHKDLQVVEFVDKPFVVGKRSKYTETITKNHNIQQQQNLSTSCLFALQGLDKKRFYPTQQVGNIFPGISCHHLTLHVLEFYLFTYERHIMWQRKTQNPCNVPYSRNPRMSKYSFCNIYRELDTGTMFLKASILELFYSTTEQIQPSNEPPGRRQPRKWSTRDWIKQVLWRSYMYRLVNRVETFQAIGFAEPTYISLQAYLQRARVYRDHTRNTFFTGAHNVSGFEPYTLALQHTLTDLDTIVDKLCTVSTSKDKLAVLHGMKLVGDFFAWQIMCDMEACGCWTIDYDFCLLGPGAKNGLDLIFRTNENILKEVKGSEKYLQLTRILTALQETAFRILELQFPYFDEKRLTLKEIEHTLCEYNKYKCSKALHTYRPREKLTLAVDCFSCNAENPENGYYCDLCNFFWCLECLAHACDHNDYNERIFICPSCRQLEFFMMNSSSEVS